MKKGLLPAVAALLTAVSTTWAASEPPRGYQPVRTTGVFSVWGTRTIAEGRLALEPEIEIVRDPDIKRLGLKTAYGITDGSEMGLSITAGETDESDDIEEVSAGFRHRFVDEGRFGPSAAVILSGTLPFENRPGESGTGHPETEATLVVSKKVGPFTGHLNVGYNLVFTSESDNELTMAAGAEFSAARNLVLLGEIVSVSSRVRDKDGALEARLGYRSALSEGIENTVGLGFGLSNRKPEYRLMISFTFLFPMDHPSLIRVPEGG